VNTTTDAPPITALAFVQLGAAVARAVGMAPAEIPFREV
jgi:hypothetical protein